MQFENVTMFHKNTIFTVSKFSVEMIFKACVTVTLILTGLVPLTRKGLQFTRYCIFSPASHCCFLFVCVFVKSSVIQLRFLENGNVTEFVLKTCHSFHFMT